MAEYWKEYPIKDTLFGATITTAALSIEDVFRTVEPVRRGVPQVGIGNVIGSLVFSVTGKLGVILLAGGSIVVGPDVIRWHLPVTIVLTALAAYSLFTGQLKRVARFWCCSGFTSSTGRSASHCSAALRSSRDDRGIPSVRRAAEAGTLSIN